MTCYICGKIHTSATCPMDEHCLARGCSPPESDLTPEDAIRRGRGTDCAMPPKPEGWSIVLYDERGVQIEEWGSDDVGSWEMLAYAIRTHG